MVRSSVRHRILGVIPARYASSRFPGKLLSRFAGKTVLQHTYEQAAKSQLINDLIIATDDERILREAQGFQAQARMTRTDHRSGTDRVAEVAATSDADIVVNIQGDEPLIDPAAIDCATRCLIDDSGARMATLKKRIEAPDEFTNPNVVKVVADFQGNAIYFSRSPIPHDLGGEAAHYKHIGLYVYRRDFLLAYSSLPVGPLERAERLEQLRAIENGHRIRVVETGYESLGVDTPEDLERVARIHDELIKDTARARNG